MPSAISLADMFAQPNDGLAISMPDPTPMVQDAPARGRPAPEVELARRQALFENVGSFFG
jgi:hypothetical protein